LSRREYKVQGSLALIRVKRGKRGNILSRFAFSLRRGDPTRRRPMGRGLLLWIIGIPLPIILVIWLLGGLS
jgi:hypothetical protein